MKFFIMDCFNHITSVTFHPWVQIKDVKDKLQELLHIPAIKQRLFFNNNELKNTHTLHDCSINEGVTLYLSVISNKLSSNTADANSIQIYGNIPCPESFKSNIILQARQGLALGLRPKLSEEGTGGTYFLRNRKKQNIAVFKAEDEEPFAPNNPRGYVGHMNSNGFRKGILSGEGAIREVAAYLLDKNGFVGVPVTTRVEIVAETFNSQSTSTPKRGTGLNFALNGKLSDPGFLSVPNDSTSNVKRSPSMDFPAITMSSDNITTKVGALQEWVDYDDFAGDLAAQLFPIKEVHKIAIMDIRMFNLDRNEANILVKKRYPSPTNNDINNGTPLPSPALGFTIVSNSNTGSPFDLSASTNTHHIHHNDNNNLNTALPPSVLSSHPTNNTNNSNNTSSNGNNSPSINSLINGSTGSPSIPSNSGLSRLQARMLAMKSHRITTKPIITLTPIDHSLTLPDTLELAYTDWCWLEWPQAKQPIDNETKSYVMSLDPKADIEMLRNTLSIREPCLRVMRISSMLLQKGIMAGLNLYQIAIIMCRGQLEQPSDLEILCAQASALARTKIQGRKFHSIINANKNKKRDSKIIHNIPDSSPSFSPAFQESTRNNSNSMESLALEPTSSSINNSATAPISSSSVVVNNVSDISRSSTSTSANQTENNNHNTSNNNSPNSNTTSINRSSISNNGDNSNSSSSDLALRRSVSHHDFRGVKVSERGFRLTNLVSQPNKSQANKIRNGCKHLDDEDLPIESNFSNTNHHSTTNSEAKATHNEINGSISNGSNHTILTEAQQNEIFFACLADLMDSHIERILAKEKLLAQQHVPNRAVSEVGVSSNNHNGSTLVTSPTENPAPVLVRSRSLLQSTSSPPNIPTNNNNNPAPSLLKGLVDTINSGNLKSSPEESPTLAPLRSPASSEYNSLGMLPGITSPVYSNNTSLNSNTYRNSFTSSVPNPDSLSSSRLSSEEQNNNNNNNTGTTSESSSTANSLILMEELQPMLSIDSIKNSTDFHVKLLNMANNRQLSDSSIDNNGLFSNSKKSPEPMNYPISSTQLSN